jgi:hypothetical protein
MRQWRKDAVSDALEPGEADFAESDLGEGIVDADAVFE